MSSRRRCNMDAARSPWARERASIIMKYERGPQKMHQEMFQGHEDEEHGCLKPDKFGFLCEKLPNNDTIGKKYKFQASRRVQKWIKMLKNYDKYCSTKKFHRRVSKGIPAEVRGEAWSMILDIQKRKTQNPGRYEQLKERARLCSDHVQEIDVDILWTFNNNVFFLPRFGLQ
ncbi:USP6 N-terminal-like protein isoform X2 [Ochotona princeps]|uniref:USP6 N-terminal-like protein isoform X2 n=1 Tax=Ochotona princeps TaxID=9978 RepID=UPI002714D97F|nr:USP6 N-terminal-like protein isoform X2 [Ochotona princeps]